MSPPSPSLPNLSDRHLEGERGIANPPSPILRFRVFSRGARTRHLLFRGAGERSGNRQVADFERFRALLQERIPDAVLGSPLLGIVASLAGTVSAPKRAASALFWADS